MGSFWSWSGRMHIWCSCLLMPLLVIFVCVHGQKPNPPGFIYIDCGLQSNTNYTNNYTGLTYVSDDQYINSGVNGLISRLYSENYNQTVYPGFDTLRSFPNGTKNCYTLTPVRKGSKYLVRASFCYGNYDGLGNPPKFDLYFGVNFWKTVKFYSLGSCYIYEIIGLAPANYIEVCLVNTGSGIPFMTSLDLRPLNDSLYALANSTESLNTIGREDSGSDDDYALRYPKDAHDRIWYSYMDYYWSAIGTSSSIDGGIDFDVPSMVLQTAAIPSTGTTLNDSLYSLYGDETDPTFLVVLHFAEIQNLTSNSLREFYLYADEELQFKDPITTDGYLKLTSVYYYTKTGYKYHNFSLRSTARATHPPILSGFEQFTILPVTWLPTNDGDVTAINTIKASYNATKNLSGDPCVPTGLGWDGVNCTIDSSNIPRITNLNLSFKWLTGEMVPAFGDLTALTKLDLSHNNLSGEIPKSLDQLVSLTFLDLSANSQLKCTLPPGLTKRLDKGLLGVNCTEGIMRQKHKKIPTVVIIIIVVVVIVLLIIGATVLFFYMRKQKDTHINPSPYHVQTRTIDAGTSSQDQTGTKELNFEKKKFSYDELKIITSNFSHQVGTGGFGNVFRGHLKPGKDVAVKVRTETSPQGIEQFLNEVELLSRIHHKNLVSLIGYCKDNNHIALVYEYMQHGSLEHCLKGNSSSLPWKQRLRIVYDSAQGLEYLHKMCSPPLIHRDVKSSNILLDTNLEAKISDFGYVRAFTGTHVSTRVIGTIGYVDPYYANSSSLTEKSDVYSFGIVLLEIITGKPPILQSQQHLTDFVNESLSIGNIESILDPNMGRRYNLNSIWKVANLALSCTDHPSKRPDMSKIVVELNESLNLENSNTEMSSMASENISQNIVYSGNHVNSVGGAECSSSLEMAHVAGMGLRDEGPLAR